MWYEYPVPADFEKQRKIIRQLKAWIESLESRGFVKGYAFDHYSLPNELRIRFDCNKEKLKSIREELEPKVRKFVPDYIAQKRPRLWDEGKTPEYVYRAYEFGSRCAFLFWDLVEKGRFSEEITSSFVKSNEYDYDLAKLYFQVSLNHGVMNSLGIHKKPDERLVHLALLIESTKSHNPQELCMWIEKHTPKQFFKWFCPP